MIGLEIVNSGTDVLVDVDRIPSNLASLNQPSDGSSGALDDGQHLADVALDIVVQIRTHGQCSQRPQYLRTLLATPAR